MPGSVPAIAHYQLPKTARICDLDDISQLRALKLRPSDVVTRDYVVSRRWALAIFKEKHWIGARWWSFYDPKWSSIGLWNSRELRLLDVEQLRIDTPAFREAARTIARPVRTRASQ